MRFARRDPDSGRASRRSGGMGRGWLVGPAELGGPRCRGARGAVGAEELRRGEEGEADEVGSLGQGQNGRARARWQVGSGTQGGRRGLRRVVGRGAVLAGERGREAAVAGLVERDAGQAEVAFGPRRELGRRSADVGVWAGSLEAGLRGKEREMGRGQTGCWVLVMVSFSFPFLFSNSISSHFSNSNSNEV